MLLGRGENSLWHDPAGTPGRLPRPALRTGAHGHPQPDGLREVFERYRPDIVLHAAAHKHVPFLEIHPCEAVENNIFGTLNVVEAALDFGRREGREHLHGQGRQSHQRPGGLQADRRNASS